MIKDLNGTADHIATWMRDYMQGAGATSLVLGLSGGIDSALCALLAKRANVPLICVNMPCHSSNSAYARAKAFAEENAIELFHVDLSVAHETISSQFQLQGKYDWASRGSAGGLRSCLRAPTLSFLAHSTNGLIIGTGNRSEDHITRYYQKFGDGCVDFSPIADLFKSEIRELFFYLASEGGMKPGAKAIYDAKPTADLWGADSGQEDEKELGITYEEIEWADRQDMDNNIIFARKDPSKHKDWKGYNERQQHIIKTLHKMEKVSRHKANPAMPICDLHKMMPRLVG